MKIVILLFLLGLFGHMLWTYFKIGTSNQAPLDIKTPDGYDQPYHPSVLFFENGWCGYRYWMAASPWPIGGEPYRDRWEYPCIYASNDGVNWNLIGENPLDDLTESEIDELDYFSDPELVMNGDTMECWYRMTKRRGVKKIHDKIVYLFRRTSTDGLNWTPRDTIMETGKEIADPKDIFFSHSLRYVDNRYLMWYTAYNDKGSLEVRYQDADSTAKLWSDVKKCNLIGYEGEIEPWHISIMYEDGVYNLILYNFFDISLWTSEDGINFTYKWDLLKRKRVIGSYHYDLYRASLIKDDVSYKLYFSCDSGRKTYIGLMQGSSLDSLKILDTNKVFCKSFLEFIPYYFITPFSR